METVLTVLQAKYWHLKQTGTVKPLADWEIKREVSPAFDSRTEN